MSKRKYNQIKRDGSIEKIPNRTRNKRGKKRESKDSESTVALTTKKNRANLYKKELEKKQRLKKVEENLIGPDKERILGNSYSLTDSDQEVKNPGSDLNKSSSLKYKTLQLILKKCLIKWMRLLWFLKVRHPLKPLIEITFPLHY